MSAPPRGQPKVSTSSATTGQSTSSTSNAHSGTTVTPITPAGPSHPVPQFEIQPDNTRNVDDDDWEDEIVIERSPRGRRPVHSILHNRGSKQGSRDHSADSGAGDSIHSRNTRPRNVTFRDGNDNNGSEGRGSSHNTNRSIRDYLTRHLNMGPSSPPQPVTASQADQADQAAPHFQPRSLAPDDSLLEEAFEEIGLSRPESPEKYAFGFSFPQPVNSGGGIGQQAPAAVSPTNAPPRTATDANPTTTASARTARPPGFQIVTVPPTVSNPLSPLASPTAESILPARSNPIGTGKENPTGKKVTMEQNPANGTTKPQYPPPIVPPVSDDTFLTADKNLASDNARRRAQYTAEQRRQHASEPGPSRQTELGIPKHQRQQEVGPIRHPRHGHGPRRPSSNRHGRPRRRADPLYRPTDPYAFPTGQQKSPIPPLLRAVKWAIAWAEDKVGVGEDEDEESGESKASSLSKGRDKQEKPTGDAIPMTETTSRPAGNEELPTSLPASVKRRHIEAEAVRQAEEQRRLELERTKERLRQESIDIDRDYKEMQRRLERERRELEHGLPTVPRTSPTQITRPLPMDGAESAHTEPTKVPRIPTSHGALSPPTASPDNRPASDPGTPPKRRSPFKLPITLPFASRIPATVIEREKKMELSLRQWLRFATIQAYRHLMLRLPSLYFNRVGRVFVEAEISAKEVELLINRSVTAGPDSVEARVLDRRSPWRGYGGIEGLDNESEPLLGGHHDSNSLTPSPNTAFRVLGDFDDYHRDLEAGSVFRGGSGGEGAHSQIDPSLAESLKRVERFRLEWESFVDGLIKEWKTLNVVSALLLSALLTVFQIQDASYEPVTRTAALLSLVSAFLSLLFGGIYIIRFSTMRTMRKAARWVEETRKEKQRIFWNIWILLSMPFTWLAYSLIFFCISLMAFIWTSGTGSNANPPDPPIPDKAGVILGPRIAITIIFSLGIIYFFLVLNTFRSWSGTTIGQTDTTGDVGRPSGETDAVGMTPEHTPHLMGNTALPAVGANGRTGTIGLTTGTERDGLSALAFANVPLETRQQRTAEMTKSLERHSTGSAESALQLELTPPTGLIGRNLDGSQLTETPPSMVPLVLPLDTGSEKPITMVTEPTPLSATDPLMHALNSFGQPLPSAEARPFRRLEQSDDLDRPLPPISPTLAPIQEVTEFGSFSRSGGRFGNQ